MTPASWSAAHAAMSLKSANSSFGPHSAAAGAAVGDLPAGRASTDTSAGPSPRSAKSVEHPHLGKFLRVAALDVFGVARDTHSLFGLCATTDFTVRHFGPPCLVLAPHLALSRFYRSAPHTPLAQGRSNRSGGRSRRVNAVCEAIPFRGCASAPRGPVRTEACIRLQGRAEWQCTTRSSWRPSAL